MGHVEQRQGAWEMGSHQVSCMQLSAGKQKKKHSIDKYKIKMMLQLTTENSVTRGICWQKKQVGLADVQKYERDELNTTFRKKMYT